MCSCTSTPFNSLHPRYFDLVSLLDASISRLLLSPTAADMTLDTIKAIMVYLQWMPRSSAARGPIKTRYSDTSAWTVFGMALRYARLIGLDRKGPDAFKRGATGSTMTAEDMDGMRVWLNLITYDCNLTLTSSLPASLDPESAAHAARSFSSYPEAQGPGDLRYAAMAELACIVVKVVRRGEDGAADRHGAVTRVKRANVDIEYWERCVLLQLSLLCARCC